MKKIIFLLFLFSIPSLANAKFVYPFKEISKSDCRFSNFESLWADCKKDLPILKTSDYKKLKDDYNYRRVYTVLWWATYDYGWDSWYWSHQWVDIATSEWTPIYAIWDWTVKIAWEMSGRWKNVTIEHNVNWRKIYSNYSHMSKIWVTSWTQVKAWDLIWRVWHTWNSYGNHLHFQIDLDTSSIHPYYPSKVNCSNAWAWAMNLVNKWYCRDDLLAKTVDPLAFLESQWAIISKAKNNEEIKKENKKQVEKTKIEQKNLLSRADIQKIEVENFLKNYKIDFTINKLHTNIAIWDSLKMTINIKDRLWKAYNWTTPDYININVSNTNTKAFPEKILILENWKRDIIFNWAKRWLSKVKIKIWSVTIKEFDFFIFWKDDVIYWNKAWIWWDKWVWLWDKTSSKIVIYKDNSKLIWVPYSWKYVLKSANDNMLFCMKQPKKVEEINAILASKCKAEDYKKTITFWINDTFQWTFYFDYKLIWSNKTYNINVLNWKTNAKLWEKKIELYVSKDLKRNHPYYQEIAKFISSWIIENKSKDYFLADRTLLQSDAISFIENNLFYKLNQEKNADKIRQIKLSIFTLRWEKNDKFKNMTRKNFFDLVYKYLIIDKNNKETIKFLDLNNDYKWKVWNIFNSKNTWKDKFWTKYFQPDKEITRWEAVYMMSLVK